METSLSLRERIILLLLEKHLDSDNIASLNENKISGIRYIANKLSESEKPESNQAKEPVYEPFAHWLSRKTLLYLRNRDIYCPQDLVDHDWENDCLYGLKPNVELLQYCMVNGIKLKNYRY